MATYTAFCQNASGEGTIWIDTIEAPDIMTACTIAERAAADDWDCAADEVHCLGLAAGDVEILHWEDLNT